MFDDITVEKLKFYVYILKDPGNNEIFYVGKGQGNRVFEHVIEALYFNSLMFQPFIAKILIYIFMTAAAIPHLLQFFTFKKLHKENI